MSIKNFWVQLHSGPPWGFRLKEEKEKAALVISRVNSKGRQQGLKEGDLVISVNGQSTVAMTHAEAQRIIRESTNGVELELERSSSGTNGFNVEANGTSGQVIETRFHSRNEDTNQAGSWSTDSTSTGSTTIHVSSLNSDVGLSPSDNGKSIVLFLL
ncbi:hypothetical protein JTE90_013683 [Oedothorax gibbosus]|uniref:PDZ domain-containing protein n=1 Tax=Oedothorax gibbosus TaxID=931172 RepID=A0AAV6VBI0_9ARAC|nr:hypothetical protein JTE90_013683 [Oedothorax gibbosus]